VSHTIQSPEQLLTQLLHNVLKSRVYDVARETALDAAPRLSRRLRNEVLVKREDLQPVFSFKLRGAYNRIAHLEEREWARGVITASAGNHAQGVAYSARRLGVPATIVMPQTTPQIKVDSVRAMGADVELHGDSYAEAKAQCDLIAAETGRIFIHAFDDPLVVAGQGTIAAEILRHTHDRLSAVFVPVGGGGLIAGMAGYIKALRPHVKVIGVEPFEADAMYRSLAAGRRIQLDHVGIFADGVAVREVGEYTFAIAQQTVDEVIRVTNDEICAAIKDVFDDTRTVMEPAGALSIAGVKKWVEREGAQDLSLAAVLSGANINFDRLRFVAERAEVGEAREALLAVTIPERPGAFREFCSVLGRRVVTEFNYRLRGRNEAHIFVGIATQSRQDGESLARRLRAAGYETEDLTDNEMAKLHVRHMVGGRAPDVRHERLCRFEFPERPGALTQFLEKLGGRWNISLFHYRNHGADFGRVLAGFEVEDTDLPAFRSFLDELGYPYTPELENPAYRFFLA
jgi:threonine dehydratase